MIDSGIELISDYNAFLAHRAKWNQVLEKSGSDSIFLRHEWLSCWWNAFGQGQNMRTAALISGGEVSAYFPLMLKGSSLRGIPVKELSFMENGHTSRSDFIISGGRKQAFDAFFGFIFSGDVDWDIMRLRNIPEDSPNISAFEQKLSEAGATAVVRPGLNSPYISVSGDWEAFYKARPSKFKKTARNKLNRISRFGEYELESGASASTYEECVEVSKKSWKAGEGEDIAGKPQTRYFYDELTRVFSDLGWLDIRLLRINKKPAAFEYHLLYKNSRHALRSDFDESYAHSECGSVLDYSIVKSLFNGGKLEYDLGGSCDFYKKGWMSGSRAHRNFIVFNKTAKGRLLYWLEFGFVNAARSAAAPFRRRYAHAREVYKYKGAAGLILSIGKKFFSFVYSSNSAIWFEKNLSEPVEAAPGLPVTADLASPRETIEWIRKRPEEWLCDENEFKTGLKYGHLYPSAKFEGSIIGYVKAGTGKVYIADYRSEAEFPERTAFIYDTFVAPEFRGKNIAPFLVSETLKELRRRGYEKVRCHIPFWNGSSIRAYTKLGFKSCGRAAWIRIFWFSFVTADRTAK